MMTMLTKLVVVMMSCCTAAMILKVVHCEVADSIPNIDQMRYAVDIANLDFFPEGPDMNTGKGNYPLFDFTYNHGRRCKHPMLNISWAQPDQVATCWGMPWGSLATEVTFSSTVKEHATTQAQHVGISATLPALPGVSAGVTTNFAHEKRFTEMQKEQTTFAEMNLKLLSHIVGLSPDTFKLQADAQKAVASLSGKTYQKYPDLYEEFFTNYGTHFFSKASFGGMVTARIAMSSKYTKVTHKSTFEFDCKVEIQSIFGNGGVNTGMSNVDKTTDANFTSNTKLTVVYYGGRTVQPDAKARLNEGAMQAWETAIQTDPWLVWGDLVPVYDVITTDEAIKQEMKEAIFARVGRKMLIFVKAIFDASTWKNCLDRPLPNVRRNKRATVCQMYELLEHNIKRLVPVRQEVIDLYNGILTMVASDCPNK